jgi:hypothetical protein
MSYELFKTLNESEDMDEDGAGDRKEIFNIVGTKVNLGSKSPKKDRL